jgi:hypothetical protein
VVAVPSPQAWPRRRACRGLAALLASPAAANEYVVRFEPGAEQMRRGQVFISAA